MNMQDLYNRMKDILDLFNVRFAQMEKVQVHIENKFIVFTHEDMAISFPIPSPPIKDTKGHS